jgi:LysM repeat protein
MKLNENAQALTNEELEQTTGGATVYTNNGFYVSGPEEAVPVTPVTPSVAVTPVAPAVPVAPVTQTVPVTGTTYVVKKGDTLSKIAKTYGTTVKAIMALNSNIADADKISVGQVIRVY